MERDDFMIHNKLYNMKKILTSIFIIVILNSCIGGGTHGCIKRYQYNVSKYVLAKAVHQVFLENKNLVQDSVQDYYNDDTNYVSMSIIEEGLPYTYTFRYYEGKEYWDTSRTSELFIAYAHDEKGKGGSSGDGGIKWYNFLLKKKLTGVFEREFIDRIDKILNVEHAEE
jgi:hypothetical protein